MTAVENRSEGKTLREGMADEGVGIELVPEVDAGGTEPGIVEGAVRPGLVSDAGGRAGVAAVGIVPAEGLGASSAAGEADGLKAVGPGAGRGAPGDALH